MPRVKKIKIGSTVYDIAHEGALKNSGFEVVTSLPTTGLFEGREVIYQGKKYVYSSGWKEEITANTMSEDKLLWGKESLFGKLSPIDVTIRDNDRCNMLSFIKPDAVSIEYSRDGGNSWVDYGLAPKNKNDLFMKQFAVYCGNTKSDGLTANPQFLLRITIDLVKTQSTGNVSKTILWCSSSGDKNWCTISALNNLNYDAGNISDDFFVTPYKKIPIGGDIGWNVLNFPNEIITSSTPMSYRLLRYTFGCDTVSSGFGLYINRLIVYSYFTRLKSSNITMYGHLYNYDYLQNAYFPAKVESNEVVNFNVTNIEPTQTGNVTKTSTWLWQYLIQSVNWLKANKVALSVYNAKVAELVQSDSNNNAYIQSVKEELTALIDEVSGGLANLAAVARSGSYNDLTDTPTLFSGSYNDLTDTPAIPSTFADLGGNVAAAQISDGLIANSKLVNSSMSLNGTTINLGDTAILPWYVTYNGVDYPARVQDNWLQIYRNEVWANMLYLSGQEPALPTEVIEITDISSGDWYDERVSEYELSSSLTSQLLRGKIDISNITTVIGNRVSISLAPIASTKGLLDNLIQGLKADGAAIYKEYDLDTMIASGSNVVLKLKIVKLPLYKVIIECYVEN